jgi:Flp pilus assembly protein TadD
MSVGRFIPPAFLITVCMLVLGFYAWTARPGMRQLYDITNPADAYYNQLVQGFRSGQLNLKREVPPGLAKLADPYDPAANISYRAGGLHDISYYKNKLYLYFGVTPAIVLFWPYAALTGHYLFHKQAVAIFCSVGFLASVALLGGLRRRYFPESRPWVAAACALALGLSTCVPLLLQRPEVYEVSISCAYAMVMLALGCIWRALHDPARPGWWLAGASLAYGLAVGARPNLLFGAVILLVPVIRACLSSPGGDKRQRLAMARMLAAAVVPISFVGLGLMLYNYLRFDSPFEFGQHYQLVANNQHERPHVFGLNNLWFNFRVYFLQPIQWGGSFPFVNGIKVPPPPAGNLGVEDPLGILPNIPLVWMALAAPLAWQKRTAEDRSTLRWLIMALVVLFAVSALTIGLFAGACGRYQVDFVPALVLLALCGVLGLERALAVNLPWRHVARCIWVAALLFSVVVSLLTSVNLHAKERYTAGVDKVSMGQPEEAILCFEQALRIKPDFPEAHSNLGSVLADIPGRLPEAISEYEAALRIKPDFAEVHYNLGLALAKTPGRLPDAIAEYEAAIRMKPDFAKAHCNLANLLATVPGREADAISEYEAALRIKPDFQEAHTNLGVILTSIPGRLPEAVKHFEAALQLAPDSPEARDNLRMAREALEKSPDASGDH